MVTLGCAKNTVDSEKFSAQLVANHFDVQHGEGEQDDNDIVIINTCGFIDKAKQQSVDTILWFAEQKERGRVRKLYVMGCLVARYRDELLKEIPQIDGSFSPLDVAELLHVLNADYRTELVGQRLLSTPKHYAYLKIAEGCSRKCSFCAIPLMRGTTHRSVPVERLVQEAQLLTRQGVKELILISQELTYYGLDLYKKRTLADLLARLTEVEGLRWIRLHYAHPAKFPLDILPLMRDGTKICSYLDIPLQHASDKILTDMRRGITRAQTIELLDRIRQAVPGITIRTTFLTGFPTETTQDVDELCDFVRTQQFDRVGVFTYSHEQNTSAGDSYPDRVSTKEKKKRMERIMREQYAVSLRKNEQKVGSVQEVLIDKQEGQYFIGRTQADSPEVDNLVHIPAHYPLTVGDFVSVHIYNAQVYDLFGYPVGEKNMQVSGEV